jgi:hypothetical protein
MEPQSQGRLASLEGKDPIVVRLFSEKITHVGGPRENLANIDSLFGRLRAVSEH